MRMKHLGNMRIMEQELQEEEGLLTQSGKIDIKRITESSLESSAIPHT